jgi:NADH-quinone oxidoreductase subunit L
VLIIGCATAVFGAVAGLFQNDIKKALAYSTVSQLGFMFMAAGVGAFDVAIFHVFTHAFFKATLFLGSGAVIHGLHHEQDMRKMGGLAKTKGFYLVYMAMAYGWWAIIGLPGGSGFHSKDLILERLLVAGPLGVAVMAIALATAGLTAVYMTRVMYLTFWSPSRLTDEQKAHIQPIPVTMLVPLTLLGFGSLVAGLLWFDPLHLQLFPNYLAAVVGPAQEVLHGPAHAHSLGLALGVGAAGTAAALIGWLAIARPLYRKGPTGRTVAEQPSSAPYGFGAAWTFAFDRLYEVTVVMPVKVVSFIGAFIVESFIVTGLTELVRVVTVNVVAGGFVLSQRSRLRTHLALSVLGLVAVVAVLAWAL